MRRCWRGFRTLIRGTRTPLSRTDAMARAGQSVLRGQAAAQLHAAGPDPPGAAAGADPAHGARSDGRVLLQLPGAVRQQLSLQLPTGCAGHALHPLPETDAALAQS